jgi:phthalate 4,5-dioxygenase
VLSKEENELITRVGPGTVMGEMLRQYWVPACLASDLPAPDCDPIQVRLLGESLVAFRDSSGRIGLMPENCPHRGASLYLGRNEKGGLRCLYHGWKFDVAGKVLDTPCEPPGSVIKERFTGKTYAAIERGDVIWAYMGSREKMPAFPNFHWTQVPSSHRSIKRVLEECNWVQSLEGSMDPPHFLALHEGWDIMRIPDDDAHLRVQPPLLDVADTRYGFAHISIRPDKTDPEHLKSIQIRPYVMPFMSYIAGPGMGHWGVHLFVPADDENNYYYEVRYNPDREVDPVEPDRHLTIGEDIDERGHKIKRRLENRYLQDREGMRAQETYSGIAGRPHQDMAMIESMGRIYDRTQEHLGGSDLVTIRFRRRLIDAVRAFEDGVEPPGLDPSIPYDRMSMVTKIVPVDLPWQECGADIGDENAFHLAAGAVGER